MAKSGETIENPAAGMSRVFREAQAEGTEPDGAELAAILERHSDEFRIASAG